MMILASWLQGVIATIFVIVCVLLILVILLQKGRGGGLSAAFGGSGGYSAFGAKTGDVFTWVTVALTFLFILTAILGNYWYVPDKVTAPTTPRTVGATGAPADADAPADAPGNAGTESTDGS